MRRWILRGLFAFLAIGSACKAPLVKPPNLKAKSVDQATLVKRAVLDSLGLRSRRSSRNFGAYFVFVDAQELEYFAEFFQGNSPRVELSANKYGKFQNMKMEDGAVVDNITKLPGAIYGFQKVNVNEDRAEVEAVVSFGMFNVTIHTYELVLKGNKWTVRTHYQQSVS